MPFISDALDLCYGEGYKHSKDDEGFLLMPNVCKGKKIQKKGFCKRNLNTTHLLGNFDKIVSMFKQNIEKSKQSKRKKKSYKFKGFSDDDKQA